MSRRLELLPDAQTVIIRRRLTVVSLILENHETKAVLITCWKRRENITLNIGVEEN